MLRAVCGITVCALAATVLSALPLDVLRADAAVPAHIAGRFREALAFQQSRDGQYYVFDRRGHTVYGIDEDRSSARQIVQIGAEAGRIIDPTAFAVEPGGTFVVADAPDNRERIQIFSAAGFRSGGFLLPGRLTPRVTLDGVVLNGIGTLQYTGDSILMSRPESGTLISEYTLQGAVTRSIGALRATGFEDDRELHLALNSGIPLVDPSGGFYFVFQTGVPALRKYDGNGRLVFERRIEGREIDPVVATLPTTWRRRGGGNEEIPMVSPTIRAAAVDRDGSLWIAFIVPYLYVYDRDGDKTRAVQLYGAGVVAANSLFFGKDGQLLVTPGLLAFAPTAAAGLPHAP